MGGSTFIYLGTVHFNANLVASYDISVSGTILIDNFIVIWGAMEVDSSQVNWDSHMGRYMRMTPCLVSIAPS